MKVLFHANHMGLRGTEVALFDYAHFNEQILGNISVIACPQNVTRVPEVVQRFQDRFRIFFYEDVAQLEDFATREGVEVAYFLSSGQRSDLRIRGIKNVVHAVFPFYEPHGDVYAYISSWLSQTVGQSRVPYVPHIVHVANDGQDERVRLGIPKHAVVFGRYGGEETFDIEFSRRVVYEVAARYPDRYFLFMNTNNFLQERRYYAREKINKLTAWMYPRTTLPNVLFLPGSSDPVSKRRFINTCDAMLHARRQGESFGLACGEFSICNKPVITCSAPFVSDRHHLQALGSKGIFYENAGSLRKILTSFQPDPSRTWDAYSSEFAPEPVMAKFQKVFLS